MKFFVWAILIYLLYRLIFDFIVPVSKATSQIRSNLKQMQQQQQRAAHDQRRQQQPQPDASAKKSTRSGGEYIEFEEVR